MINEQLSENPDEVRDAIKKGNGIFAFTIKGNSGVTDSWHVDLKSTGSVGKGIGEKPSGKTSDSAPAAASEWQYDRAAWVALLALVWHILSAGIPTVSSVSRCWRAVG